MKAFPLVLKGEIYFVDENAKLINLPPTTELPYAEGDEYVADIAVLAENIEVEFEDKVTSVTFDWLCENCDKRHWARELVHDELVSGMGVALECGWSVVRFPWRKSEKREALSIYGQTEEVTA